MPINSAESILEHGFQKGSGRVGRTTTLDEDRKVKLAVEAHIRHEFTPYEELLREKKTPNIADDHRRERARAIIRPRVLEILAQWSAMPLPDVAPSSTSVSITPTPMTPSAVTRSTSSIVGDAVTRSYHAKQAARGTTGKSVEMATLENSIHARGAGCKNHEWNDKMPLIASTTTGASSCTSSRTSVRTIKDIKSPHKRMKITMTTAVATEHTPSVPSITSLEACIHASVSTKNLFHHGCTSTYHSFRGETSKTRLFEPSMPTNAVTPEYSQESSIQLSIPIEEGGQISSGLSGNPGASKRKRTSERDEDDSLAKRPKQAMAISSRYAVEEPLPQIDVKIPSAIDSLPIHGAARLDVDFDAMHLDDVVEPRYPTTAIVPEPDILSGYKVGETSPESHSGIPADTLDATNSKRIDDLRSAIRKQLATTIPQKHERKAKSLPATLEFVIIGRIKRLLNEQQDQSKLDLKIWQSGLHAFTEYSKSRQHNIILAEFREHLLQGRMDHNLYLLKRNDSNPPQTVERYVPDKLEAALSTMVGVARKDYHMLKRKPDYQSQLSPERSWAAGQVCEFRRRGTPREQDGLRDVFRKRLLEMTGDKGSSADRPFEIAVDEEEDGSQAPDDGVVSHALSFLSERPLHRPCNDRLVSPSWAQPCRGTGLGSASDMLRAETAHLSGKENSLAIMA
ncbi:hypothetical protein MMC26_002500 [Xylographa opegraphella]|nr:hypothetical protein [Xylographa opegraphella]